jgi:glycosyl transferase/beta-hydroxylase protein BlmF
VTAYVIATNHPDYRDRRFEPGDIVIDPWRVIPDQPGVTVRRLGQNRPALISLLVPSRGRPDMLKRMVQTAMSTAAHQRHIEIIAYLDDDDPKKDAYHLRLFVEPVELLTGPRKLLSDCWNECARHAKGEILMHAGDDLRFETPGWDQQVRDAFAASEDKILLVQGDDLSPNREALATHGFVHRRWVETVGYFLPPLFSCDWNDVWLTEVADMLGRRVRLPFVIAHDHYQFDKRPRDTTDEEREERGRADNVVQIYKDTARERIADMEKLKAVMG